MPHKSIPRSSVVDLTIIITAHAEGILLHKTLASVRRAALELSVHKATYEILIHCDNPTDATASYVKSHVSNLKDTKIFTNNFGDLGSSRNYAVAQASGKYVTFIDADDLMSGNWLAEGFRFLESQPYGEYIAHSEKTLEFGDTNSLIIKHGATDRTTDTLLSVYANRWNSIIIAPRYLLLEEPYATNTVGYGYEDWHLNCRFIARGIHNVLIPETVIFVRRKSLNSEWARQISSRSVLHANPLLSFNNIRSLPFSGWDKNNEAAPFAPPKHVQLAKTVVARIPNGERYARKLYSSLQRSTRTSNTTPSESFPSWLLEEWRDIHVIEKQLYPTQERVASLVSYDSFTSEHFSTGQAYKRIVDHTSHDSYDYILFVPWLMPGGADLFAINYANTIHRLKPGKTIAVIATLPDTSAWSAKLAEGIDFIPFGTIAHQLPTGSRYRLLEQFIENSGATHLHVINSELAYDFIETHQVYLKASDKKIIATSFSQSRDHQGHIFGYSHTHIPQIYDMAICITTDNIAVKNMWINEYGFDESKILVHNQPVSLPVTTGDGKTDTSSELRVLWAARLSPEKQPHLVTEIGELLNQQTFPVTIDMYGHPADGFDLATFTKSLPSNVHYKGSFDGFYNLPAVNYDVYLYTSLFDGMPNAILEAAACKLPIVSSSIGGIPEFITDHTSGRLINDVSNPVDYAETLKDLCGHPELRSSYASSLFQSLLDKHSMKAYEISITEFIRTIDL